MAIFTGVESRTWQGRLFHTVTFIVLILGGITMVYPFVLMISGSFRSEMDATDLDLVPSYFHDEDVLYRKFLETKYDENTDELNRSHLAQNYSFRNATVPAAVSPRKTAVLEEFLDEAELPRHWEVLGGIEGRNTVPENLRTLRERLTEAYDGDIHAFSEDVGTSVHSWLNITFNTPQWMSQRFDYEENTLYEKYFEMQEEAPLAERRLMSVTGYFLELIIYPRYGDSSVDDYNEAHAEPLESYGDFRLPERVPGTDQPQLREEWIEFVLEDLNASFIVLEDIEPSAYHDFLRESYEVIEDLNVTWERDYESFADIALPDGDFLSGVVRSDYQEFLRDLPPEHFRLVGPEYEWHDWLEQRYGSIAHLNEDFGTDYASYAEVWLPVDQFELEYVRDNAFPLRWTYAIRNYVNVIDAALLQGRAFLNTVIYCALAVLLSLLVNPLAAYGLSRFQLPGTYKILLLVMATMAFPPMVTTIPVFIMMQNLGLMNTFAGLLLPTIANGYLIFLLKGFFDSLPRELYDAGLIDGASELRMFFSITMALSKPILAVVGLMAFNSAYTVFLFALIIAPDEDMWLMSVWLYQYRETVHMGGVFASVLLASIPPIVVFIFAQNIILRGIVVPVEK